MSKFQFTKKSFDTVMNSRNNATVEAATKSRTVLLTIKGNGNVIDVKNKQGEVVAQAGGDGVILQKKIFNTNLNSSVPMKNPANISLYKQACAAEKAGEKDKAHKLFNDLANKLQVSFGLLLPSKFEFQLSDGVEISAKLSLVTTEKGQIITIDPKSIRVIEPEVLATGGFTMDDPFAYESSEEEEETADVADVLEA